MSGECDIFEVAKKICNQRDEILDLFCKTFFVSQEPRSPEELRYLFETCELEMTHHSDLRQTYHIKLRNEGRFCAECKNETVACVCMNDEET